HPPPHSFPARRSSDLRRSDSLVDPLTSLPVAIPKPKISSSTFSPEVTLTYFPNSDTTLFASYKKGYKSGSYSLGRLATSGGIVSSEEHTSELQSRVDL